MHRWIALSLALLIAGCNRNPPEASAGSPANTEPTIVEIRPITPLLPRLQTHFSVDSKGNLYWLQESDPPAPGGDLIFLIGMTGVPQTLENLSTANLLDQLDLHGATGAIHSLAIGPDDNLYLLFIGSKGARPLYFIAQYVPSSRQLKIVADTPRLMQESGMGASLPLAKGSLLNSTTDLWLWVRHTDGFALLQLQPRADGELTMVRLTPQPPPHIPNLRFNDEAEHLSAGLNGVLYMIDPVHTTLWQIQKNGEMVSLLGLLGLPQPLTPPAENGSRIFILFGEAARFTAPSSSAEQDLLESGKSDVEFPALLAYTLSDHKAKYFDRNHLMAPENFPLQTLDPRQLTADLANNTLVTFDAGTGELLRLRLSRQ